MNKNVKKLVLSSIVAVILLVSNVCVFAVDSIAPTAPQNLRITNRSGLTIQLSWDASTDNVGVNHYELWADVYNAYDSWTEQKAWISVNDQRKVSVTMETEREFSFYVIAKDDAGNVSAQSNRFEFNADATAPTAPTNVHYTNKTSTSVTLAWNASTDNFSGIKRYWIFKEGPPYDEWVADSYTTSAVITGLTPNTTYTFYVGAIDNGYDGNQSEFTYYTVTTNP